MKKLILSVSAILGVVAMASAQSIAFVDATAQTAGTTDTTIDGAVNNADLNLQLLAGSSAGSVSTVIATLLLSDGSATGDITAAGYILDNSGTAYSVPAADSFFQVLAWTGQYTSYAAAVAAGSSGTPHVAVGTSAVFNETLATGVTAFPGDIGNVGTVALTTIPTAVMPEPSTLAMAGVGLASMLIFRRRNS